VRKQFGSAVREGESNSSRPARVTVLYLNGARSKQCHILHMIVIFYSLKTHEEQARQSAARAALKVRERSLVT
jgi:hypothetical protein